MINIHVRVCWQGPVQPVYWIVNFLEYLLFGQANIDDLIGLLTKYFLNKSSFKAWL